MALALSLQAMPARAEAESPLAWHWAKGESFCDDTCAVTLYAGKFLKTEMVQVFGTKSEFIPFWDWTYEDSWMVSGAFTRKIGGFGRFVEIEAEGGVAKRFGGTTEIEFWGAIYYRWMWFPWNDYIRTSIGVSTGFNWASGIPEKERIRAIDKTGRQLLHYFSPEFTLGLPSQPDWDVHVRIHHRSGWFVFPGIGGGAQFLSVGLRKYFLATEDIIQARRKLLCHPGQTKCEPGPTPTVTHKDGLRSISVKAQRSRATLQSGSRITQKRFRGDTMKKRAPF